jgi:hypothetical protein
LTPQSFAAYYQGMAENRPRTSLDCRRRPAFAVIVLATEAAVVFALVLAFPWSAGAQPGDGGHWSGYERKGHFAKSWDDDRRHRDHFRFVPQEQVSAGWFQRPYPYHLDYYRMRYGGSYAPYFGNLYGPPNYNYYGSPYYGDYSPYYGYNGYPPNGYQSNGYPPSGYPGGYGFGGPMCDEPQGYVAPDGPPVADEAAGDPPLEP